MYQAHVRDPHQRATRENRRADRLCHQATVPGGGAGSSPTMPRLRDAAQRKLLPHK
ncbi:Uncharacterised protein [Amycolatopsis camponoti]|uniref:Uncharacterized protein n=1 Tax=Amycolatopsis camponoti TaxID=2606593 RepID=A0A6I8LTR2_9PSEU|nr:Uncharacterised protein [Amycolatopsis camponoti]